MPTPGLLHEMHMQEHRACLAFVASVDQRRRFSILCACVSLSVQHSGDTRSRRVQWSQASERPPSSQPLTTTPVGWGAACLSAGHDTHAASTSVHARELLKHDAETLAIIKEACVF